MPSFDTIFSYVIIPALIFLSRIADQSVGTMRLVFVARGYLKLAPLMGFFEVTIWLLAMRQIMVHMDNPICFIAYGAGFAMGNYVGLKLEERLSLGMVLLRVVFRADATEFVRFMAESGYGYTLINGEGSRGNVKILLSAVKRKVLKSILTRLAETNPKAFYTIEDVKKAYYEIFPPAPDAQPHQEIQQSKIS